MRYASIRSMDISNGKGVGISLFVQGCHFHCKNCFNKETWDFNGGTQWTPDIEESFINLANRNYIKRITILGGEPLTSENISEVLSLVYKLKHRYPNKEIWIYTGYTYEYLSSLYGDKVFNDIDYIVDGQFIDELKDYDLKFKGSSNQRVIDVKRTILKKEIITYED